MKENSSMKFQSSLSIFLVLLSAVTAAVYDPDVVPVYACVTFSPIIMRGKADFVNTDGSIGPPTVGDMSIGTYQGEPSATLGVGAGGSGVPDQYGGFKDIDVMYRSECVITESGLQKAPTCSYKFDLKFCRITFGNDDCRFGTFSAYGKGPGKIAINGGTDDFLGAYGQITTTAPFNPGNVQRNGDLVDSEVEMRIQLCYDRSYLERSQDVYALVDALDYDIQKGIRYTSSGQFGYFDQGDYVGYNRINFGPSGTTSTIKFNYAKGNIGGTVNIRIGGLQGRIIGSYSFPSTGNWNNYSVQSVSLDVSVSGYQDLFFEGATGTGFGIFNLRWFELAA